MNLDTSRAVDDLRPLTRDTDARELADAVYARTCDLLDQLDADDWRDPTECARWDVAAMVGHLIGAAKACASVRQLLRQQLWGWRHADEFDGNSLDAFNELQVRDHADLTPSQRVAALRATAPAAVRGRMRVPGPMRRLRLPLDTTGSVPTGMPDHLRLGHLMDVIYTRDVWLHAVDIARATGRPYDPDPQIDGRVVEDVVAEWAAAHGQPFVLTLTGPAGGRYHQGEGGPEVELDAVELCRILSGRAEIDDVEVRAGASVPAAAAPLFATRVLF